MNGKTPEASKKNLNTLSDRLAYALHQLKVTQAELARKIKIKPQAIHYLCHSRSQKSRFTYEIADALKINSLWLASGEGSMEIESNPYSNSGYQKIPLLSWQEIKEFIIENKAKKIEAKKYILSDSTTHANSFSFKIKDTSMHPRFDQNTTIVIDTQKDPQDSDLILIYLKSIDDIIFRQLEIKNNKYLLHPLNTIMYKCLQKNNDDKILGVMVEARWHT